MSLHASWRRFRSRLADQGVGPTLVKLWKDHVFRITQSVVVEFRAEWQAPLGEGVLPAGVEFVSLVGDDPLPPLCDWLAHRAPAFRQMLRDGKRALFITRDGVAYGCVWLSLISHHDAKAHESYEVLPGEAYHYCWLLDPDQRNSKLSMVLCRQTMRHLHGLGIRRQFGIVDLTNAASYLVQYYFGYRECGQKVTHLYILGTQWTIKSRYEGNLGPQRRSRVAAA
jgi:RimJ/RimL family protein N-acetyltransferase